MLTKELLMSYYSDLHVPAEDKSDTQDGFY